jgi:hypothetical protein
MWECNVKLTVVTKQFVLNYKVTVNLAAKINHTKWPVLLYTGQLTNELVKPVFMRRT